MSARIQILITLFKLMHARALKQSMMYITSRHVQRTLDMSDYYVIFAETKPRRLVIAIHEHAPVAG